MSPLILMFITVFLFGAFVGFMWDVILKRKGD